MYARNYWHNYCILIQKPFFKYQNFIFKNCMPVIIGCHCKLQINLLNFAKAISYESNFGAPRPSTAINYIIGQNKNSGQNYVQKQFRKKLKIYKLLPWICTQLQSLHKLYIYTLFARQSSLFHSIFCTIKICH